MRQGIIWLLCVLFIAGCSPKSESRLFNFPVEEIADIEYTDTLAATLLMEDAELTEFVVVDSLLVSYLLSADSFLSVVPLGGEDLPLRLCKKGRGPGEFAMMAPSLDYRDGFLSLVDIYYKKYFSVDLVASLDSSKTVIDKEISLLGKDNKVWPVMSAFLVGEDSLLVQFAADNPRRTGEVFIPKETPDFALYDLKSGDRLKEYDCLNGSSLNPRRVLNPSTLLHSFPCMNDRRDKLCFVMARVPQINYLDVKSGEIRGLRLQGRPAMDRRKAFRYFTSVVSYRNRIYALYSGEKESEEQMPVSPSSLYVFDWEGNIKAKYLLDAPYQRCVVTRSGVYLSKWDADYRLGLYRIPQESSPLL